MQSSSKFCKVTSNLLPCSVSFDFFQSPLGLLGIVHENFTWGSTSNEAIPYRMASRSSSISSRSFIGGFFCQLHFVCLCSGASGWQPMTETSWYIPFFSKNISLSCSFCDGLGIVLVFSQWPAFRDLCALLLRLIKAWVKNDIRLQCPPPQQGSRNSRGLRE